MSGLPTLRGSPDFSDVYARDFQPDMLAAFFAMDVPSVVFLNDFRVIEPLRKLVCTEAAPNGGYYNPSRLVYGTNAWLKVGVNGDFDSSEVRWRVVSGPGRIADIRDWAALVEPTAPAGEVVVDAAFGSDSAIQPQFVLPIVEGDFVDRPRSSL